MFGERVRELGSKAASLRDREHQLLALSDDADEPMPTPADLAKVRDELEAAASGGPPALRRALAQAFVHELVVEDRQRVLPTFKVMQWNPERGSKGGTNAGQSAKVPGQRAVRLMEPVAPPTGFEPVPPP